MAYLVEGILPVMLTPFTEAGEVDCAGLERLTDWYLAQGADALFSVAQSSEMQFLSLSERTEIGRFVVRQVGGRVPVVVSGHISDDFDAQVQELTAMGGVGADGLVLVTNHLDPTHAGAVTFKSTLEAPLARIPSEIPLGLYECPAPYRRLLTDDELSLATEKNRFVLLKDVSCDLPTVKRRIALAYGSQLAVINANAAIARDAMRAGSRGFGGVFTNFYPDLYKWMRLFGDQHTELGDELATFLVLAAVSDRSDTRPSPKCITNVSAPSLRSAAE